MNKKPIKAELTISPFFLCWLLMVITFFYSLIAGRGNDFHDFSLAALIFSLILFTEQKYLSEADHNWNSIWIAEAGLLILFGYYYLSV